ncbi:MAG: TIGR01906 family membrane protein [Dehalococcoidia bacterium]|nr:TIGR01906 family membrane protein [Dehalococcoidia bacterium]
MKLLSIAGSLLFILAWPLLLTSTSVSVAANSPSLYNNGFDKYNIPASTGIGKPELKLVVLQMIDYYNSDREYLDIKVPLGGKTVDLFNEREIEHMKDVKGLINFSYLLQWSSILYVIIFGSIGFFWRKGKFRRSIFRLILKGSLATLAVVLILSAFVVFNFQGFFLGFHLLSFSNDLWVLDPSRDYLIKMFTEGFFFDATLYIGIAVAVEAAIICGLMTLLLKKRGSNHPPEVEPLPPQ